MPSVSYPNIVLEYNGDDQRDQFRESVSLMPAFSVRQRTKTTNNNRGGRRSLTDAAGKQVNVEKAKVDPTRPALMTVALPTLATAHYVVHLLLSLLKLIEDPRVRDTTRLNAINSLNALTGLITLDDATKKRIGHTLEDFWKMSGQPQ